jgi:PUA-domain protein
MPKSSRYFLKDRDSRKFIEEILKTLGLHIEQLFGKKVRVEVNETENAELFFFNGKPLLARVNGILFPTLLHEELFSVFPKIVVDMGAVPYVCKGADVMAPGVVSIVGEFEIGQVVIIIDERHNKPLAVGLAKFNSEELKTLSGGKIVKSLHYIGDKLWDAMKS